MPLPAARQDHPSADARSITYRLATTAAELEQAFELVWNAYVRVGLERSADRGIRLTKYHLLPHTKVFVAVATRPDGRDKVVGTVSVVPDGALGLPVEQVAGGEIAKLRQSGERPVEFVALAIDDEGTRQRVFLNLFRLGFEYCRRNGYSTIVASLTERHIGFYRRFLGFEPIGALKPYEMGNGTPVQAHYLNLDAASTLIADRSEGLERDPAGRVYWQTEASAALAIAKPARPWDSRLVERFVGRCRNLADQLDAPTVDALASEYSRFGWEFPAESLPKAA